MFVDPLPHNCHPFFCFSYDGAAPCLQDEYTEHFSTETVLQSFERGNSVASHTTLALYQRNMSFPYVFICFLPADKQT